MVKVGDRVNALANVSGYKDWQNCKVIQVFSTKSVRVTNDYGSVGLLFVDQFKVIEKSATDQELADLFRKAMAERNTLIRELTARGYKLTGRMECGRLSEFVVCGDIEITKTERISL